MQSLPHNLLEPRSLALTHRELKLPPIDYGLPSLSHLLPPINSVVSAAEWAKDSRPNSPGKETCGQQPAQTYCFDSSISAPRTTPVRAFQLIASEVESAGKSQGSFRSASFSGKNYLFTETEWRSFAYEELYHVCRQISSDRPQYNPNVESHQPKRRPKKGSESQVEPKQLFAGDKKREGQEKHAAAERARREHHKCELITQYQNPSDYALRVAKWEPNSVKPPTKEVIMYASNIHTAMLGQLITLGAQELARRDQAIADLERRFRIFSDPPQCSRSSGSVQLCQQETTVLPPNYMPNRAIEENGYWISSRRECSTSGSSTRNKSVPPTSPTRSLPSLSESFQGLDSGLAKRKREADDNETTPTGPLRYVAARNSTNCSPRSATSSRGSWCWLE